MIPIVFSAIGIPENITGPLSFAKYVNDVSGNWYWVFMLITVIIICISWLSRFGISKAFAASIFLGTALSIPLAFAGLVSNFVVFILGILLATSVLMLFIVED